MGRFAAINEAEVSKGGVYFPAGRFLVELARVFCMTSRKGDELFIAECKVLISDNQERPVGSTASWVVNLKQDAAFGNIKGFLAAVNGIDPGDRDAVKASIDEEVMEVAVAKSNPLAGMKVGLETVVVQTRAGDDFTKHYWSPVVEQEATG